MDVGSVDQIFLPINSSEGDLPHHGSGVALYESSARKGSVAFLRRFFTVCTALSACPLLDGKWGLLVQC